MIRIIESSYQWKKSATQAQATKAKKILIQPQRLKPQRLKILIHPQRLIYTSYMMHVSLI
jgi:hypothetical protein